MKLFENYKYFFTGEACNRFSWSWKMVLQLTHRLFFCVKHLIFAEIQMEYD